MLTPFSGAGSECVAAKITGRHYIGFEIDKEYCNISENRLANTQEEIEQMNLFEIAYEEKKQ